MNTTSIALFLGALLGSGGIGALVTEWFKRHPKDGSRENALIDQLQEMVDSLSATNERHAKRETALVNYVWSLQAHINDRKPPPPPQWPTELF